MGQTQAVIKTQRNDISNNNRIAKDARSEVRG